MWSAIINLFAKIIPFVKECSIAIAAYYIGSLKDKNKELEAKNAAQTETIKVDNDIAKLSDDDVLNELRADADKPKRGKRNK